jgi:hypothetical protein
MDETGADLARGPGRRHTPTADPGELVDDDTLVDDEAGLIGERTPSDPTLGRSAEEEAVHVVEE